MMPNPFFSIIIPVYDGVSNNLQDCLGSIWEQPLSETDYEVICVDDCSTDATKDYLSLAQFAHPNLKVICHSVNSRQGGAKNTGIRAANGEYVLFIDQDDYYHPDVLDKCFRILKDNPIEVLVCDSAWQQRGKESNQLQLNYPFMEVCDGRSFVIKNGFALAPWRMICKREYLLKHDFFFQENVRIEDIDWGCKLVMLASQMRYEPILLVHYNRYEAQTTGMMKYNFDILADEMFAAYRILEFAKSLESPFAPLDQMWRHHYKVSLRMMLGCYAPIQKKVSCLETYCIGNAREYWLINSCYKHRVAFAVLSNLVIPFYRLFMSIFTWIRWSRRQWKKQ